MKQHLVAFGQAALDASAGLVTLPFIADPLVRASSNIMQLMDDWMLNWTYFGGVGLTRARLSNASGRVRGYPNLYPLMSSVLSGSDPVVNDMRAFPHQLRNGENVTIQVTNGAANDVIGLVNLCRGDMNYNIPQSGLRKVRFTAALTSVAYTWGPESNVVLDDDLEAGMYAIYGMQIYEADIIAARLIFQNQVERPGVVAHQTVNQKPWEALAGGLGFFGTFNSLTPPFIQCMHVASAVQAEIGYLLIGKVGN